MTLARVALLASALVLCAWFALGIRQAQDTDQAAAALAGGKIASSAARSVASELDGASLLNPDRGVDVLRARLALAQGHSARARAILFDVIRAEPKFLDAWVWYARASTHDPVAYIAAQIGIRRLIRTF